MRVIGLITARLKSSRLPRKAFLPINGVQLLDHLLRRLDRIHLLTDVVLCTSDLTEDEPLVDWAIQRKIPFLRGDSEDVLERLCLASRFSNADELFCVTGDNPFVSPQHAADLMRFHMANGFDFSATNGLPIGTYGYALRSIALERVCAVKASTETEIWGPYFTQGPFNCGVLEVNLEPSTRELRLTVDTPEDYALACKIASDLGNDLSIEQVSKWAAENADTARLNRHIIQRSPTAPRFRNEVVRPDGPESKS